jgi:hypothetical protein
MAVYYRSPNILLPEIYWSLGSGGATTFSQNGNTGENERVNGTDPWGNSAIVWETRASGDGNADGGWNTDTISIDNTKLYRFSVWVKRTSSTGGGTFYLGLAGGGQCVMGVNTNTQECNPYWHCGSPGSLTQNQWYLVVAHAFPYTHTGLEAHPNTGFWTTAGSKVFGINQCNLGVDAKWHSGTTSTYHRTYHFYCGDSTTRLQLFQPRIDLCDGSEPTISQLLSNSIPNSTLASTTISPDGSSFKDKRVVATGGVITTYGDWRIHRFNSSGTFSITATQGTVVYTEHLLVGGGGGGGMDMGGGGGGGGVISGTTALGVGDYTITVGAGGTGAPAGSTNGQPGGHQFTISATAGGNTTAFGLTAYGGGYGASSYFGYTPNYGQGGSGASGGGASGYSDGNTGRGGSGTQGYNGGGSGGQYYSGGGGGAGGAGTSGTARADGGPGKYSNILGRPFYWGGGGGGAAYSLSSGGVGGIGGGGGGALGTSNGGQQAIEHGRVGTYGLPNTWAQVPGGDGGTNTGGGGGGGSHYNANNKGGNGGAGIVIIRYKYR